MTRRAPCSWAFVIAALLTCTSCTRAPSRPERPNILLISMDTLRADHLGAYGYARNTSPNIDALAARGTLYENASSTSAWTSPAHASLFTGKYPHEVGITLYRGRKKANVLEESEVTLAEVFREHGYHTTAFTGGGFVAKSLGFAQGFSEHRERKRLEHYLDDAVQYLESKVRREPFFMFLHFYNCHRVYNPPPKYAAMFRGDYAGKFPIRKYCGRQPTNQEDWDYVVSQYDGEIAFADHMLGDVLRAAGENTLIVFLSDHGEEFNEHGGCDHTGTLYQELIHIPLIFAGPQIERGKRVRVPVSLLDVPRTVLAYAKLPAPRSFGGTSLFPWATNRETERPQFFETGTALGKPVDKVGARRGSRKWIKDREGPRASLYDLDEDPGEQKSLAHPQQRDRDLESHLEQWAQSTQRGAADVSVDAETQEALEALGYVE